MKHKTTKRSAALAIVAAAFMMMNTIPAQASVLQDISIGSGAIMNQVTSYAKVMTEEKPAVAVASTESEARTTALTFVQNMEKASADKAAGLSIDVSADAASAQNVPSVAVVDASAAEETDESVQVDITGKVGAGELFDSIELDDEDDAEELTSGETFGYTNLGVADVSDHLNIRASAEEDSKLVGKMGPNSGCEVLGVEGNMAHISSGSVEGYVSLDYLLTGEAAIARATEVCAKLASVNADGLKLRREPNTECSIAGMVSYGEELPVVDDTLDGWVSVSYDGETVYVCADYVSVDEKLKTALNMTEVLYGEGVSDVRVALCEYAKQFLGNPYVWGGTSLTKGADCSGYVLSIFAKYGIYLPHSSRAQAQMGSKISLGEARPGDLVFYAKGGRINHVGIYIGGGQIINASSPKTGIRISNVYYRTPVAVRRILPN